MVTQHPFQCIQCLRNVGPLKRDFVVAAAGPHFFVFDALTGTRTSTWPATDIKTNGVFDDTTEPPEKRRKITPPSPDDQAEESSGGTASAQKDSRSKHQHQHQQQQQQQEQPNVVMFVVSSEGGYIVAATGEDKCIRVFQVDHTGHLSQLSERYMPKRPSALRLCNNNSVILVADKFGDVFSLPLQYDKDKDVVSQKEPLETPALRQPAATSLTVHTKGNLRALEQQREQAAREQIKARKAYLFPHTLLLGHVSMVTDIEHITLHDDAKKRSYLLSADRDEHIRVSRGLPQTHIIEGYCFGHESFVNKLCVPSWDHKTLISGGGDDVLITWDWLENRIRQKVELNDVASNEQNAPGPVTGIWAIDFSGHPIPLLREVAKGAIIVALERCSHLRVWLFDFARNLVPQPSINLRGSALDLAVINDAGVIMVAIDGTTEMHSGPNTPQSLVQMLTPSFKGGNLKWSDLQSPVASSINANGSFDISLSEDTEKGEKQRDALKNLLYSASTLQKGVTGNVV